MGTARAVRDTPPCWGYGAPGLFDWIHEQLAEDHIMLMGATTYRAMSEIVAAGDDPTFSRMAELPKIVFSKSLQPPLTWANTMMVFPIVRGETGEGPVFTELPDLDLSLTGTRVIDDRLVLVDYRVADQSGA
jgi:hypothetical protein